METGLENNFSNKPTCLSGFMNHAFDSEATLAYTLFLLWGSERLVVLVKNNEQMLAGEQYDLSEQPGMPFLKQLFSGSELLNQVYKEVNLFMCQSDHVSLPLNWLEVSEEESMLIHASGDKERVVKHYFDSKNKHVFGVPPVLHKLISQSYKHVNWLPATACLPNDLWDTFDVIAVVWKHKCLLFKHTGRSHQLHWSAYDHEKSLLYAVLSLIEIEGLNEQEVRVGLIADETEPLIKTLQPYVANCLSLAATEDSPFFTFLNELSLAHH